MKIYKGEFDKKLELQIAPAIMAGFPSPAEEYFSETLAELKRMYDGYHFSEGMTDIYNPFSLVKAFDSWQIKKYWFESATPSALIDMLRQMPPIEIADVDGVVCESDAFDDAFDTFQAPLPALYQSGYLTIKDYSQEDDLTMLVVQYHKHD
jgi:hypothetical protein